MWRDGCQGGLASLQSKLIRQCHPAVCKSVIRTAWDWSWRRRPVTRHSLRFFSLFIAVSASGPHTQAHRNGLPVVLYEHGAWLWWEVLGLNLGLPAVLFFILMQFRDSKYTLKHAVNVSFNILTYSSSIIMFSLSRLYTGPNLFSWNGIVKLEIGQSLTEELKWYRNCWGQ
jgi:hypothetical protein